MKLMTFNIRSHALLEDTRALQGFVEGVLAERPEVIALQEVCQRRDAPLAETALREGFLPAQRTIPLRADNFAFRVARLIAAAGMPCRWTWLPVKVGYGAFDEGLAILCMKERIVRVESVRLSRTADYAHWKRRSALAVQTAEGWFCNVHLGWWQDEEDPFQAQWEALRGFVAQWRAAGPVWLMGDFNAPAEVRREGYDCIRTDGWHDAYQLARRREGGATAAAGIDGWQGAACGGRMRIDHIWCSAPVAVERYAVVFSGDDRPAISDHAGVLVQTLPADEAAMPGVYC